MRSARQEPALGWALFSYVVLVTLVITLFPFRFQWPEQIHFLWFGGWSDTLLNVLFFLPLGFLYKLIRPRDSVQRILGLGLGLSCAVEMAQIFLAERFPSPLDVLTNGIGAWLGALLVERTQRHLSNGWIGSLALELPLMNVVYLLVPLIWLNGLAAGNDSFHHALAMLLGLCGCLILSAVYLHLLESSGAARSRWVALSATGWFLIGSLPRFSESPALVVFGSGLVALATRALVAFPWLREGDQRRFEIPVLKRVWPIYVAYLMLLSLSPLPSRYKNWSGVWGFHNLGEQFSVSVWWLTEYFAAFTLLGYIVAESYGRRNITQGRSILWSCFWCGVAAALLEVCRGFHPRYAASFLQGLFAFTGSLYGSLIYWLQLHAIQRMVGHQAAHGMGSSSGAAQFES
jgi:glycopeptide antibiotics resistance protein